MYACQMPDVIDVINVIYVINDIYDLYVALTYTICRYVNIGVKRSVWTSGMQPSILKAGAKLEYSGERFQLTQEYHSICSERKNMLMISRMC